MTSIRNSAKAVIIRDELILLTKNKDEEGFFYLLPGGGQEKGEELSDAVARECIEEIGCAVVVRDLLFVREYIGKNHEFAEWDHGIHQVEFYFDCSIDGNAEPTNGSNPDEHQVGVEWLPISSLNEVRIYPHALVSKLTSGIHKPCYIGDSN